MVKERIASRRFAFRNRERTNRLLQLIQLDINRQADRVQYAKDLRLHLEEVGGHRAGRRTHVDPYTQRSLRP
jgi:hypothetical protein